MDANPEVWRHVEDILRCPVCFDMLQDARFLPCGHTFCQTCIEDCQRHYLGMNCPMCRRNSTAMSVSNMRSGLSDLPRNLIAQDMAEIARTLTADGTGEDGAREDEPGDAAGGPIPARPAEEIHVRRPRRFTLGNVCRFIWIVLFIVVYCGLLIVIGLYWQFTWLNEYDQLQVVTISSALCKDLVQHSKKEELGWFSKMVLFYQNIFDEEDEKRKTTWEKLKEKLKEYLTETSVGICDSLEESRLRRLRSYNEKARRNANRR